MRLDCRGRDPLLPNDVFSSYSTEDKFGGNALQISSVPKYQEAGVIWEVYPDEKTVTVYTDSGRILEGLGIDAQVDSFRGGEICIPRKGQPVRIDYALGRPVVILSHQIPSNPPHTQATDDRPLLTQGVDDSSTRTGSAPTSLNHGLPRGTLPGDKAWVGDEGNLVAVLSGGLSLLKGSEYSQIIASRLGDLVRIVSRNFEHFSDFGEIHIKNEGGKNSFILRGGADQLTETGGGKTNYTLHVELGAAGDLISVKVTDAKGNIKWRYHVDSRGNVTQEVNDVFSRAGSEDVGVKGDSTHIVGGDKQSLVTGNDTRSARGEMLTESGGSHIIQTGEHHQLSVLGDLLATVGRLVRVSAAGNTLALPGDDTVALSVTNGSLSLDIGDPTKGDAQTSLPGLNVNVPGIGGVTFDLRVGGAATLSSFKILTGATPNAVVLGGVAGISHVALFEPLQAFLEAQGILLDTHVHATPWGPTSPPVAPIYNSVRALVQLIRSLFVMTGG